MPVYDRQVMCGECPFRANALKGWLGPATPQEVNDLAHGEGYYSCHIDLDKQIAKGVPDEELHDAVQHCVGFLRYRTVICKHGRDPEQSAAQDALNVVPDKPIIPGWKFLEHHGLGLKKGLKKKR